LRQRDKLLMLAKSIKTKISKGETMNNLIKITVGLLIITMVIFVSDADYQDQVNQAETYKYNVCHGYHPDYEGRKPQCD